jgi:hypothetical protein
MAAGRQLVLEKLFGFLQTFDLDAGHFKANFGD